MIYNFALISRNRNSIWLLKQPKSQSSNLCLGCSNQSDIDEWAFVPDITNFKQIYVHNKPYCFSCWANCSNIDKLRQNSSFIVIDIEDNENVTTEEIIFKCWAII